MQWVWVFMRGWPGMLSFLTCSALYLPTITDPSSLDQGSANYDLQDKSSALLFLQIEFYWKTIIHTACILSMEVSCHDSRVEQLQQRWAWPAKLELFTIWLFIGKVCRPLTLESHGGPSSLEEGILEQEGPTLRDLCCHPPWPVSHCAVEQPSVCSSDSLLCTQRKQVQE